MALITDEEIFEASEAGEGPKLMAWSRVIERLRQAEAENERLRDVMIDLSEFAVGNGDVCEIIARRLRKAALEAGK